MTAVKSGGTVDVHLSQKALENLLVSMLRIRYGFGGKHTRELRREEGSGMRVDYKMEILSVR